jgi:DNA-binding IscR family transcriptional regulator
MTSLVQHTSIVLAAFTKATMTVEQLSHNTMLSKPQVSAALEELKNQGKVEVAGGAWTLLSLKKKGSDTVSPTPMKKAPGKRVAKVNHRLAAKKAPAKKVPTKKVAPVKKAAKKSAGYKAVTTPRKSVAAINGAKKHAKVAERDEKVMSIIAASKKVGITDEGIAKSLGTSLSVAYQSVRRLKDEGRINSSKGDDSVTRRYAA